MKTISEQQQKKNTVEPSPECCPLIAPHAPSDSNAPIQTDMCARVHTHKLVKKIPSRLKQ